MGNMASLSGWGGPYQKLGLAAVALQRVDPDGGRRSIQGLFLLAWFVPETNMIKPLPLKGNLRNEHWARSGLGPPRACCRHLLQSPCFSGSFNVRYRTSLKQTAKESTNQCSGLLRPSYDRPHKLSTRRTQHRMPGASLRGPTLRRFGDIGSHYIFRELWLCSAGSSTNWFWRQSLQSRLTAQQPVRKRNR